MRCASEVHKIDCRHFLYTARFLYISNGQIHSFQFSAYTMTPPSLTIQLFSNDLLTTIICSKFKMGKNWVLNVQMTLGGPGCRLQTCRRREAQWFDSTFWAAQAPRFFAPHHPSPGFQVHASRFPGFQAGKEKIQKFLLQVRLELTTPACLFSTVYKYRALTDCATGATCSIIPTNFALLFQPQKIKLKPKKCRLEPKMCHFTIQIAKKDSG